MIVLLFPCTLIDASMLIVTGLGLGVSQVVSSSSAIACVEYPARRRICLGGNLPRRERHMVGNPPTAMDEHRRSFEFYALHGARDDSRGSGGRGRDNAAALP